MHANLLLVAFARWRGRPRHARAATRTAGRAAVRCRGARRSQELREIGTPPSRDSKLAGKAIAEDARVLGRAVQTRRQGRWQGGRRERKSAAQAAKHAADAVRASSTTAGRPSARRARAQHGAGLHAPLRLCTSPSYVTWFTHAQQGVHNMYITIAEDEAGLCNP